MNLYIAAMHEAVVTLMKDYPVQDQPHGTQIKKKRKYFRKSKGRKRIEWCRDQFIHKTDYYLRNQLSALWFSDPGLRVKLAKQLGLPAEVLEGFHTLVVK